MPNRHRYWTSALGKPQWIGWGRCPLFVCISEFHERLRGRRTSNFRCSGSFVTSSIEKQPAAMPRRRTDAANDAARRHRMTSRLRPRPPLASVSVMVSEARSPPLRQSDKNSEQFPSFFCKPVQNFDWYYEIFTAIFRLRTDSGR